MKTKWMCVAFWTGTMLLTGCHTAVSNRSGEDGTDCSDFYDNDQTPDICDRFTEWKNDERGFHRIF